MTYAKFAVVSALALGASVAVAQEGDAAAAPGAAPAKKVAARNSSFTTLPFCRQCEGTAEVQLPGGAWSPVEEGKFYPLGAAFRTQCAGKLTVAFGADSLAAISGDASFGTLAQALGVKSRTVVLGSGELTLDLADNMPEGAFIVTAPDFEVKNPAGESRYVRETTASGERTVVRCVTGSLALSGRHFDIPQMRAANELVLTSEHDRLVTILENTSGDYLVRLDQGVRLVSQVSAEGETEQKAVSDKAELKLSPKMKINIHRAVPSVGERMSVFVMAFDAAGNPMGPGVSFCEGRAEVNSGALVTKVETEADALAKKAAEASETEEAAAEDEEAPAASSDTAGETSDGE